MSVPPDYIKYVLLYEHVTNLLKKTNDQCHDDTNQHINKKNKGYIEHLEIFCKSQAFS